MKKFIFILSSCALLCAAVRAEAQLNLGKLSDVVSSMANVVYSAPVSLNGTYTYSGVAISTSSSEGNVLTNLAGSAVSSGLESKADEQLSRFGIQPGSFTMTFDSSDNTFSCNILNVPLSGTYKVGDGEKTVTLTFGKTLRYLSMTGNLESHTNGCRMVFQADKLLTLLKRVASLAGQANSQIGTLTQLADGYDQFKIGFKLSK